MRKSEAHESGARAAPGYNTPIPSKIITPDKIETRIGTLKFFDGIPTQETAALVYDNLDFLRGVETFLNGVPATSLEALRIGQASLGARSSNQIVIFDRLMDSNPLFLTGNTSTVYALAFLDLKKDGPTVVEIPAGAGPGTTNDAFFRFVIDHGPPGPDRGKGGKYLILPPDYEGHVPDGYFTARSTSWVNWLALRGFLDKVDSKPDEATKLWKEGLKIYPLAKAANPPANRFISICVYDPQTRSELQTGQPFPSYNNVRDKDRVIVNDDGSVDLYFGPEAPAGKEANWIQTVPGKGWFCLLRLYDPLEPWYDKTWRPGEIELVE
jgi:hypothetical protein